MASAEYTPPPQAEIDYQLSRMDENQGPMVRAISGTLIVIAVSAVALRFVAKVVRKFPLGWDDWLSIGGLVFSVGMCVINIKATELGLGRHVATIDPREGYKIFFLGFALCYVYAFGHWFIKMAILFTYKRLFNLQIKWFVYAVYTMMGLVTAWTITQIFMISLACTPLNYLWERYDTTRLTPAVGKCNYDLLVGELVMSVLNTVGDFVLLLMPIACIAQLKMDWKKKLGVMAIFTVGAFACGASIMKVVSSANFNSREIDASFDAVGIYLWTSIEAVVGLAVACIPNIGPLFRPAPRRTESDYALSKRQASFGAKKLESADSHADV